MVSTAIRTMEKYNPATINNMKETEENGTHTFTTEDKIVEVLRTVYDPEIPVNVYDLGLIYKIDFDEKTGILDIDIDKATVDAVFLLLDACRIERNGDIKRCSEQAIDPGLAERVFIFKLVASREEIAYNSHRRHKKQRAVERLFSYFVAEHIEIG